VHVFFVYHANRTI